MKIAISFKKKNTERRNLKQFYFLTGNKVYGLFVEPKSRLLFYTHREGHNLAVLDVETKKTALIHKRDEHTSFYGVVMDRRPENMHIYFAIRNVTQTPATALSGGSVTFKRSTWSKIMRCLPNGDNCTEVVSFSAVGEGTEKVPWIYELSIDYKTDRLYFSTGQNRSIMYIDMKNWESGPKIFATEGTGDKDPAFIYGVQVYNNYLLATDWQHRGIHVYDLTTQKKIGVVGGQFFTGLNGAVVYSDKFEESMHFSTGCEQAGFCSHLCVPMPNNKRACKCPEPEHDPIDGVNCQGTLACPKPNIAYGSFDESCNYRPGSTCTFTCGTGDQFESGVSGKKFQTTCQKATISEIADWTQSVAEICKLVKTTTSAVTPVPNTVKPASTLSPKTTASTSSSRQTFSFSTVTPGSKVAEADANATPDGMFFQLIQRKWPFT